MKSLLNKSYFFQEVLLKNPVLIGMIGLCPIVAICTTLKVAIVMSIITIVTLVIAQTLTVLVFKKMPTWFRMSFYAFVGMIVVCVSMVIIDKIAPEIMLVFGIYLPLLAVNPVIVRQCEREGINVGLFEAVINSICVGIGYSLVLLVVGFIRELLGNGSIWGYNIKHFTPIVGFLMPMGGFVVLAYLAAALRTYFRKLDPEFADELAVNSSAAIKKQRKTLKEIPVEKEDVAVLFTPASTDEILKDVPEETIFKSKSIIDKLEDQITKKPEMQDGTKSKTQISKSAEIKGGTKVTHRTDRLEFITLDLSAEGKAKAEAEAFAAAAAASKAKPEQRQRIKRNQAKKIKGEEPQKLKRRSLLRPEEGEKPQLELELGPQVEESYEQSAEDLVKKAVEKVKEIAREETEETKKEVKEKETKKEEVRKTEKKEKIKEPVDEVEETIREILEDANKIKIKEAEEIKEPKETKEIEETISEVEKARKQKVSSGKNATFVRKSKELEELMSKSLDDILNELPIEREGDEK
ncbi:MAG: hypothetical protein GX241_01425 [Ruminococcaceae bacterium]|nr:hypothetical protein [Oscillospiraceae bacterium]